MRFSHRPFTIPHHYRPPAAIVILCIIAGIILRLPSLTESLWHDEVFRTRVILGSDGGLNFLLNDVHNPFYNGLMLVWTRLFGDTEVVVRLPSLIAGLTLIAALWSWARRRFGGWVAWWSAAWLLLSPVSIWYSTEAKNSIFSALFAVLTIIAYDHLAHTPPNAHDNQTPRRHTRAIIYAVLASAFAIITDFQLFLVLIPVWIVMLIFTIQRRRRPDPTHPHHHLNLRLFLTVIISTLILLTPLLIYKANRPHSLIRDYLNIFSLKHLLGFLGNWLPMGNALPAPDPGMWPVWYVPPSLFIIPLLFIGIRAARTTISGRLLSAPFLCTILFYLLASLILHALGDATRIYQERNLIVLLGIFPILIIRGCLELSPRLRTVALTIFMAMAIVSSTLIATVLADKWTVNAPNPDWQDAADAIADIQRTRKADTNNPAPILVISRMSLSPLRYYKGPTTLLEIPRTTEVTSAISEALRGRPDRDVLLVRNPYWGNIGPDEIASLDLTFPIISSTQVRALTIEHRSLGGQPLRGGS